MLYVISTERERLVL